MSASFTVFVCSTFSDLAKERNGVLDAIRRVQQKHTAMEFFGARTAQPIETCLEQVRASDVLIVIVGHKYGSVAAELGISFSEVEYEEGFKLGKPCLVYIRDDDVPVLPRHMERNPEKLKLLEAWKERLRSRHRVASFKNGHRLSLQVVADLGVLLDRLERSGGRVAQTSEATQTSEAKGVSEAKLREVLKRLGEPEVAEAEILDHLTKVADELLNLRHLAQLRNGHSEFASTRAPPSAPIEKDEFNAALALREEKDPSEPAFLERAEDADRLRPVLDAVRAKLAEADVPEAQIPERLAKAADELRRLHGELARLRACQESTALTSEATEGAIV